MIIIFCYDDLTDFLFGRMEFVMTQTISSLSQLHTNMSKHVSSMFHFVCTNFTFFKYESERQEENQHYLWPDSKINVENWSTGLYRRIDSTSNSFVL